MFLSQRKPIMRCAPSAISSALVSWTLNYWRYKRYWVYYVSITHNYVSITHKSILLFLTLDYARSKNPGTSCYCSLIEGICRFPEKICVADNYETIIVSLFFCQLTVAHLQRCYVYLRQLILTKIFELRNCDQLAIRIKDNFKNNYL